MTGFLPQPQSLGHMEAFANVQVRHVDWALSSLAGVGILMGILTALLLMMDAFNHLGVTSLINRILAPVLKLSGLDSSVASITTDGVLLGLAYGGGLIIAERDNPAFTPTSRHHALCWLSLCHALIEDVALMVAIGGNFWVLSAGRLVLTLVIVRILVLAQQWLERSRLQTV
jgi:hypothetical protein